MCGVRILSLSVLENCTLVGIALFEGAAKVAITRSNGQTHDDATGSDGYHFQLFNHILD